MLFLVNIEHNISVLFFQPASCKILLGVFRGNQPHICPTLDWGAGGETETYIH